MKFYSLFVLSVTQFSGGSRISHTGGANPKRWGTNLLFGQFLSGKLHENERYWTESGAHPGVSFGQRDLPMQLMNDPFLKQRHWRSKVAPGTWDPTLSVQCSFRQKFRQKID